MPAPLTYLLVLGSSQSQPSAETGTHIPSSPDVGASTKALAAFDEFLAVNRLVGDGLVRNGRILSWADFDAVLALAKAAQP